MSEKDPSRPEIDSDILQAFIALFFPRQDLHAQQRDNGRYRLYPEPVTPELVEAHLWGEVTLGTYALTQDSQAFWIAIDADGEEDWSSILKGVKNLPFRVYLEQSRRGGHAWLFFEQPVTGSEARRFARSVLRRFQLKIKDIEVFPKQGRLADGPGSLIRLPLGYHRKVKVPGKPGKRFVFQTVEGKLLAPTIREQLALLAYAERVPHTGLQAFLSEAPERSAKPVVPTTAFVLKPVDSRLSLSERIKQAISVKDFVSRYVELDGQNSGFCPFHDDEHTSFGVNETRNYWSCFAGCGGGTVIDFWMKWREVRGQDASFTATLKDLAEILGL